MESNRQEKIDALLKALRIMLEADLIDLESVRTIFKAPKPSKQGKGTK